MLSWGVIDAAYLAGFAGVLLTANTAVTSALTITDALIERFGLLIILVLGEILTGVVAERGTGILLVEHDMALVRQVCAHIYVLDFGRLVFEGTADEMLASDVVRAAYLGSEEEVLEEHQEGAPAAEHVTEPA